MREAGEAKEVKITNQSGHARPADTKPKFQLGAGNRQIPQVVLVINFRR